MEWTKTQGTEIMQDKISLPLKQKRKRKKKKKTHRVQLSQSWLTNAYPDRIRDEIGFDSNRGIIISQTKKGKCPICSGSVFRPPPAF